jgi:hypothetical protein
MVFLIRYDRRNGRIESLDAFDDTDRLKAEQTRLELELSQRSSRGASEIVLLEAKSEADLRKTHRRYFESARELVKSAVDAADSSNQPD